MAYNIFLPIDGPYLKKISHFDIQPDGYYVAKSCPEPVTDRDKLMDVEAFIISLFRKIDGK